MRVEIGFGVEVEVAVRVSAFEVQLTVDGGAMATGRDG